MTTHGELDFETWSMAGNVWSRELDRWVAPPGAQKRGISAVAAPAYAEHPSTDILTLSYRLPPVWLDTSGRPRAGGYRVRWRPGLPNPQELFDYLAAGGLIEAHKAMFERMIWLHVAQRRYGWPELPFYQLRCSKAKACVNQYPPPLEALADVLQVPVRKNKDGRRLLEKFSYPRNPTKKDPRLRIFPEEDPADFELLQAYCDDDIEAERLSSNAMEDLSPDETHFWLIDQEINFRGLGVDRKGVADCIAVMDLVLDRYGDECRQLTGGLNVTQLEKIKGWLHGYGIRTASLDEEHLTDLLATIPAHPPGGMSVPRRVLELRALTGSASVKKLYQMANCVSYDGRLRDILVHHGARTGRPTGEGAQPLNMPRNGPKLVTCASCSKPFKKSHPLCPWCNSPLRVKNKNGSDRVEWVIEMVDHVLDIMSSRSLELVEWFFGDAMLCISGCLRGLFVADNDNDLIASDYSAIEAVVMAMLAGEQWRIEAFRENKPIYLMSAAKITGRTLEEYLEYYRQNETHHDDRQKIGKVAELGLGFGGWIGAWRQFDDSDNFTDDEVKKLILAWRDASPAIVEFWGGQYRVPFWDRSRKNGQASREFFGCEGAAIQALLYPGQTFYVGQIAFYMRGDALKIRLPSTRELTYRDARLSVSQRNADEYAITYMTWNTNPTYGPKGWVAMSTFGGRLAENIVQAVAHDILRDAIKRLRAAGYPTVLHVYDEIVGEIRKGFGSLEEFERIMAQMSDWCADWPVRASGGWRGRRYRKAA